MLSGGLQIHTAPARVAAGLHVACGRRVDATLLQPLRITLEYLSPSQDHLAAKIRPNTKLVYLESPSSLLYEVLDLPALAAVARAASPCRPATPGAAAARM